MVKGLVAGTVNLSLALAKGTKLPTAGPLTIAAVVGFFGYGISLVLFVLALRYLGSARTGAYFSTAPFIGATLAVLIFREPITTRLAAAAFLMGIGLWLHLVELHYHEHTHEEIIHEHRHVHDEHHHHQHQRAPDDAPGEPHTHAHPHERLVHRHPHYPDIHHRQTH